MGFDKPARFRTPGAVGHDGPEDLEFNELGGTRIAGPTGSKTEAAGGAPPSPKLALNYAGAEKEKAAGDGGLPEAGAPHLGANDAGRAAAPNLHRHVLSKTERDVLWKLILEGAALENTLFLAKLLKGSGDIFELKLTFGDLAPKEEGLQLALHDGSLTLPMDDEINHEVLLLYKDYDVLALSEFHELRDDIKKQFDGGWRGYLDLRHLYYKAGYNHPPTELNKINTRATFLGCKIAGGVHPDLEEVLKVAEAKLNGPGPLALNASYNFHIGGFVPRGISDNKSSLSNHALGKAIDIDAARNPQFSKNEALILDKVLTWLKAKKIEGVWWLQQYNLSGPYPFSQSLTAASLPDGSTAAYREMEQNSLWIQAFLREMYPMRHQLKTQADQARKFEKSIHKHDRKGQVAPEQPGEKQAKDDIELSDNLERLITALAHATPSVKPEQAIKHGIISLPPQVFMAMAEAGARSGLDPAYHHKKDSMHFEVLPKKQEKKKAKAANK